MSNNTNIKSSKDVFTNKSNIIHNNKYEYSKVKYINNKTKVIITCKKHGDFEQRPDSHIVGKGCRKCAIEENTNRQRLDLNTLIDDFNILHNNRYDYTKLFYKNIDTKIEIICKEHGSFFVTPRKHLLLSGCKKCSNRISNGELIIRNYLIDNNVNFTFQKTFDDCRIKYPLKFDFYLDDYNIIIEFDGIQHFKESTLFKKFDEIKLSDSTKNKYCLENNIELFRISYNENIQEKLNHLSNRLI